MGSSDAAIRAHGDASGRIDGWGGNRAADHAEIDRRAEGLDHPEAHDGAQEHHSEVPEARRRGEEGRDGPEAQDGGRAEGLEHPEASRFAEDRVPSSSLDAGSNERGARAVWQPAESAEEAALHIEREQRLRPIASPP
jgi:hypothetical protein